MADERYMERCFQLALLGAGNVAPNPMVGAVLVHNDRIIGEGYHEQFGEAHAEVNCIRSVSPELVHLIPDSTLYVSLEPCAHFGKTPPCADLIINQKIPRVVIGCTDVFDQVAGKGIEKLQAAGVDVKTGVLGQQAIELNKRFFTFHTKRRPYIILKWAQTADLKMAPADQSRLFISNELANRLVHKWRSEEASIMVATNTALLDNPSLTNRLWSGRHPVRIVIDKGLRIPPSHNLFDGSVKTIVFNSQVSSDGVVQFIRLNNEVNYLPEILESLYTLNIQSVLVEGGTKLLNLFISSKLWDEARIITNLDLQVGDGLRAPGLGKQHAVSEMVLGNNRICFYKNHS